MKPEFDIGDLVKLTARFTDPETGDPVDPDSVICTVRFSKNLLPTVEGGSGVYTATVEPDRSGLWTYAFDGIGAHQASAEGSFIVRRQAVPRA